MSKRFSRNRGASEEANVDIAPLLDMVFILLIFFIVTSTFTRETGLDISKPKASSATELSKESILVGLSKQGTLHINETQISVAGLGQVLKNMMRETPDRPVIIVADRDAPTGMIVDVLDECNQANIPKVSVSAAKE
jgi:biopolymer transport protein ExbD